MSHALFAGSGGVTPSASRYLVEFKAGKMSLQDGWVRPNNRKGMVYVHQGDDNLMHFCWKDRTSGLVEDDLIIFPDDCEFKRVTQCTTGRVYLLKFKSSSKKYFFWMQEPKEDKDADLCKKINDSLNNPPQPGSGRAGAGAGGSGVSAGGISGAGGSGGSGSLSSALSGLNESELSSMFGNISQNELMQLLQMGMQMGLSPAGLMRPASTSAGSTASDAATETPTASSVPSRVHSSPAVRPPGGGSAAPPDRPATAAASAAAAAATPSSAATAASGGQQQQTPGGPAGGGRIQLSDLQTILTSIGSGSSDAAAAGGGADAAAAAAAGAPFDLNDAMPTEALLPLLSSPEVQSRLLPYLPDSADLPRSPEELRRSVQSPQFRQCVSAFAAALRTGELGPLVAQFGVGEAAVRAAGQGNAEAFLRALQQPPQDDEAAAAAAPEEDVVMAATEGEEPPPPPAAPGTGEGGAGEEKMDES